MSRPLLLKGATLIDGINPEPIQNACILVRNHRITAVGQGDAIGLPDGAEEVDLTGRWVIPGLIEMHTHMKEWFAPVTLAAGVTTFRNTGSWMRELQALKVAPPDAPAPRAILAGRIFDGPPGLWGPTGTTGFTTDSPEAAREEVRRQAAYGADLVKIYGLLSREVAAAVVEEASAHGLPVSCDFIYQTNINVRDAARMGVRWNEHASGFIQALYPTWSFRDQSTWDQVAWDAERLPELDLLCEELINQGMMLCPTLTLWDQGARPEYWWPEHPVTDFFASFQGMKHQWDSFPERAFAMFEKHGRFSALVARTYRRMGGVVVAGTDAPAGRYTAYGISLHREMELLVHNGWSPEEALWSATSGAARALHRDDIGRVRPGAYADMVVLFDDPLVDIRNTLLTDRVIKGGRIYSPKELIAMAPSMEVSIAAMERLLEEYYAGQHEEAPEGPEAKARISQAKS